MFCLNRYTLQVALATPYYGIVAGQSDFKSKKAVPIITWPAALDYFTDHIRSAPAFYAAIRNNTFKTDAFKPAFMASYMKMKSLYPKSKFPDVYFIMGAFTSGGTVSDRGLLLGVN